MSAGDPPGWLYNSNPNAEWQWYPYQVKNALWDRFLDPEYTTVYILAGIGMFSVGNYLWSTVKPWFKPSSLLSMIPGSHGMLKHEVESQVASMIKPVSEYKLNEIPQRPRDPAAVWKEMLSFTDFDVKKDGTAFAYVYDTPCDEIKKQIDNIFLHFSNTNALSPLAFPSLRTMENAVVSAVATLLHCDDACGSLTSGGTESLFCAIKAYRDQAEAILGITEPEMIAPVSCHPAINKACHILKIKLHMIPINENTGEVDMKRFENSIHPSKTICLLGSAPSYPHGIIDPIEHICQLGETYNIPVHVDACIGGFILPFIEQIFKEKFEEQLLIEEFSSPVTPYNTTYFTDDTDEDEIDLDAHIQQEETIFSNKLSQMMKNALPYWDFRLPRVTSISLDLHKYGYTPKGSSLIMYRTKELRKHCFYATSQWIGGLFVSPTFSGTRGGGNIASSYAALQLYGIEGYKNLTRDVLKAKEGFIRAILANPELEIIGTPLSSILSFKVRDKFRGEVNILAIGDVLEFDEITFKDGTVYKMQRKWKIEKQNRPDSIHMTLMPMHVNQIEAIHADLPMAIKYTRENNLELSSSKTAGMYGLVVRVDQIAPSLLTEFLKEFESTVYTYKDSIEGAPRRLELIQQDAQIAQEQAIRTAEIRQKRAERLDQRVALTNEQQRLEIERLKLQAEQRILDEKQRLHDEAERVLAEAQAVEEAEREIQRQAEEATRNMEEAQRLVDEQRKARMAEERAVFDRTADAAPDFDSDGADTRDHCELKSTSSESDSDF